MRSAYTNTKVINGQSSTLQKLCWLLLCFGIIGLSTALVYTLTNNKVSSPNTASTEVRLPYGTLEELVDPKTFMSTYLSVNCNSDLLRRTQSIRVTGTIERDGFNENFTLIKKRPNKMRITIKRGSQEIIFGVSAETVWQCIRAPGQEDQFARIEGEEAVEWAAQSRFFDWIISASQGRGEIAGIEVDQWAGNDCLKVRVIDTYGNIYAIFIDPQTLYPLAERQTTPDGKIIETIFKDYRNIDGLPTPFQLTISRDNKILSKIQLNNTALNVGLLSELFELPGTLQ